MLGLRKRPCPNRSCGARIPAGARYCPRCGVDAHTWEPVRTERHDPRGSGEANRPQEMVIQLGRTKRLLGLLGYVSLFLIVGSAVVWFLVRLGTPLWFAVALVAFMIVVMVAMGAAVERNLIKKDTEI
jgi:Flp pilus assembly protein TadB